MRDRHSKRWAAQLRAAGHPSAARARHDLADSYVKHALMRDGSTKGVPPALIEAKRAQLKLHRLLRELT